MQAAYEAATDGNDSEESDVLDGMEERIWGDFEDDDSTTHKYYSIDPATGASFNVISEEYGKYYHSTQKDSAYFREIVDAFALGDSTTLFENGRTDTIPWCRSIIEYEKNKGYRAHYKLVLNGRTIYTLCCFQAPTPAGDSIAQRFFNSFTLLHPQEPAIFSSTLEPLLVELQKADSAQMQKLLPDLRSYEVDSTEKSILEKSFTWKFPDDTSDDADIRYILYDKYYRVLDDSMTSARHVLQHYEELGENPRLRILALTQLASTTDETCYRKLKEWLLRDRPYASYAVYTIFSKFYSDSIDLAKTLYPEFLTLASDSNFTEPVYYTTYRLLDIGVLQRSDVEPGRPALQKDILAEIERVAPGKRGTNEYFETLEGMLRVLNNFDGDTVMMANKNIVSKGIYSCYADAVKYMARHNVQAEEKYLKKCLAKPEYRIDIYNALDTAGKSAWYPKQYRDQKYFAESDLYGYYLGEDWDYVPDEIKFKEAVPVMVDSVQKMLYLFQVINSGEKPVLAWAGPYSMDAGKIETSGDWTGSEWDNWDNKTYMKLIQELEESKNKEKEKEESKED